MSISSTIRKSGPYVGNGVTTAIPFSFKVFTASEVRVVRTDLSGAESDLALTTNYTVSLNANQDSNPGGTVNLVSAQPTGYLLTLTSQVENLQPVTLANNGGFYPSVINDALDRLTVLIQQLAESVSRSLKTAISTPPGVSSQLPAPVPYKVLAWNGGANALENIDPSGSSALGVNLSAPSGSSLVGFVQSGTGVAGRTAQAKMRESFSVLDFGADPTGVSDSTPAIAAAISALRVAGGGTLNLGRGHFLLNGIAGSDGILTGISVPYISANGTDARIRIVGEGKATVLLAGSNNMILARYSDSHGGIENVTFSGNGKTGVKGLAVVPENTTQTTTVVNQLYNVFEKLYILNTSEAIWLKPGPRVTGVDSGCWYNKFEDIEILSCTRALWLDAPSNSGPLNTRNKFINVRGGQSGMNTGLQIDSGATNTFYGCDFEGIASGVSPNATPTAVKISSVDTWGSSSDDNQFYGCFMEACTRDLDNANTSTVIYGGLFIATKFGGGAVNPRILLGGDPSLMPLLLPGLKYGEGVTGYPSGHFGLTKEIYDNDYPWQDWALSTANVTNTASVLGPISKYSRLNNVIEWHFDFSFNATAAGAELLITPPIAPNNALYLNRYARNSFYSLFVEDGTGIRKAVEAGWTSTGSFYIKAPAAWNTLGNNNAVFFTVRYHN